MGWFHTPDGKQAFHALSKRRLESPSESEPSLSVQTQEAATYSTDLPSKADKPVTAGSEGHAAPRVDAVDLHQLAECSANQLPRESLRRQ
jgi:hypothetical protein